MKSFLTHSSALDGNSRREMLNGEEHLVVPVIAIREGVMNNMLYTKEVIEANVQTWNGVPIPVGHPKVGGKHVSANSPEIETNLNIGKVFNSKYEDGMLKAEFWINIKKAKALGYEELVKDLEEGKTIGVSTGLYSTYSEETGFHANTKKEYSRIALDMRPDHIAILHKEKGACSLEDGCGAGKLVANHGEGEGCCGSCAGGGDCEGKMDKEDEVKELNFIQRAYQSVKSRFSKNDENLNGYFVFEKEEKTYKQKYTSNGGEIQLLEDPTEIDELDSSLETNTQTTMKKDELIGLIVNGIGENIPKEDKDSLSSFDLNTLAKLNEAMNKKDELTANERDELVKFQAQEASRVNALKESVKNTFGLTDEAVAGMTVNALEELSTKTSKPADYSLNAGSAQKKPTKEDQDGFDCNGDWTEEN